MQLSPNYFGFMFHPLKTDFVDFGLSFVFMWLTKLVLCQLLTTIAIISFRCCCQKASYLGCVECMK